MIPTIGFKVPISEQLGTAFFGILGNACLKFAELYNPSGILKLATYPSFL